jgi:hypothetical protein
VWPLRLHVTLILGKRTFAKGKAHGSVFHGRVHGIAG